MRSLSLAVVVFAMLAFATPSAAGTPAQRQLFFDANMTVAATGGPSGNAVGHLQIGRGTLRDAARRVVGSFAFTCRWVKVLPGDDALEHCSGWGRTADGRIEIAGTARRSDAVHTWSITRGTDAYRGAHGTAALRDVGQTESLVSVSITTRTGVGLTAGVVAGVAADASFSVRARALCSEAARQLASLPPFPYASFDALHPDPKLLPRVGRFFTGPHDARPALRAILTRLRALGQPPAAQQHWRGLLAARSRQLATMEQQDRAALASDVTAFVRSVGASERAYRQVAITSTVFGLPSCIF